MPTIVVDVMPKPELLDPQGKAVAGALNRTGHALVTGVRQGKRFEITVDGPVDDAVKAEVRRIAEEILSNQVIEDVVAIDFGDAELGDDTAAGA
ncbi:phosphoribosylformylglycinamidine synthase subunit PurS [Agromyces mediolanus]|uniref:phosphoribosylformylglycinamidine synthase subunit PurS n=1 Tax=Agromyces mediolanus TaxID=41986 RepID=UPI000B18EE31